MNRVGGWIRAVLLGLALLATPMSQAEVVDQDVVAKVIERADKGDVAAQALLGLAYFFGDNVPRDTKKALVWFRKAAEQGDAESQFNLGVMYSNGNGVTQNHKLAADWFLKAAKQGHMNSQANIGLMYANGDGVTKDDKLAVKWLSKAAKQGDPLAQGNFMYRIFSYNQLK